MRHPDATVVQQAVGQDNGAVGEAFGGHEDDCTTLIGSELKVSSVPDTPDAGHLHESDEFLEL